mgnify:CR=1 FL=1
MCIAFTLCIAVNVFFAYQIGWKSTIMALCGACFVWLGNLIHKEVSNFKNSFYE